MARGAEEEGFDACRYAEAGAERAYLQVMDLDDLDHLDHLRLVAAEVMPHVG